jgi:hypothetical protein
MNRTDQTRKEPRTLKSAVQEALEVLNGIRGVLLLAGGLAGGVGSGWVMADAGGADVNATQADSIAQAAVAPVKKDMETMQRVQGEMWGAMMDKDTAFKAAVEARAAANQEAARKRSETEKLFKELTGGSQ